MSVDKVKEYLKQFGLSDRVMEFDQSSATVDLAAEAVGVEPDRIAKTLSFQDGEGCLLIVAAGKHRIDNPKFKKQFSKKAKMLSADDALRLTGHAVGGVCPFALPEGVKVYLDESLKVYETIYPAAGSDSSAVRLTPEELFESAGAIGWIDVCKL
ncbi:MAG: YbaK/EbsC family protein [Lachnospiraceae bacterium]|nr:YbaK/EbsC family protein [Lachnospiraceae bacterium]